LLQRVVLSRAVRAGLRWHIEIIVVSLAMTSPLPRMMRLLINSKSGVHAMRHNETCFCEVRMDLV
jgi:hypothetical protein